MTSGDVVQKLALFSRAGIGMWIGGGWGVDAMVGRQTREHADLDIMFNRNLEGEVIGMLSSAGFRETLDLRPGRFVMSDGSRELDLHPAQVVADGTAVLYTHDGGRFNYPADAFTTGLVTGHPVPCIGPALQWTFHHGYGPGPTGLHDLALLRGLLGR